MQQHMVSSRCAQQQQRHGAVAQLQRHAARTFFHSVPRHRAASKSRDGRVMMTVRASSEPTPGSPAQPLPEVYPGMFGPWRIEPSDRWEVWTYRVGLTATVVGVVGAAAICSIAPEEASAVMLLNPLCALGAAGLGISLVQIHIYVNLLKKLLQVLWAAGVAGAVFVASQHPEQPLPLAVAHDPGAIWFIGPAAAAMTGVAVKEGICYGKAEAAALALLLPLLCLSHLAGDIGCPQATQALLAATAAAACVFAARKYTQPVKEDIGDKSVFEFRKLSEAEQERILARMQQGGAQK